MRDGRFYFSFIDPLLQKLHNRVAAAVPEGASVIDIACGNGTLPMKYAAKASRVTGIDLSAGKLAFARKMAARRNLENLSFLAMDATDLSRFQDKEFDIAIVSMAIHQFGLSTGFELLENLQRIAAQVLIADYRYPMPGGFAGFLTRLIERLAGEEHNRCFREYLAYGGLPAITGAICEGKSVQMEDVGSVFQVATCPSKHSTTRADIQGA